MHLRYRVDAPILVFQMGKVGSTAVYAALKARALPVDHLHLLTGLDALEASMRWSYEDPSTTLAEIERGRRFRERIDGDPGTRWNIITMVRDPVARNVSAFFEGLHQIVPGARDRVVTMDELGDAFLNRFSHAAPTTWIQSQLTPVFGIDPFTTPFPHSAGFQILEGERARVLIIRSEDLSACFETALQSFLGLKIRALPKANVSENKWYAPLAAEFSQSFEMPQHYLDEMYGSAYARHFYTPEELARFESRYKRTG